MRRALAIICIGIFALLGCEGPEGPAGAIGPQGSQGDQGISGQQGPLGPQGPQGNTGNDGSDGEDGATGPQGDPGTIPVFWEDWNDLPANPAWHTSGDQTWAIRTSANLGHYGDRFLISGPITHSQESSVWITGEFENAGLVTFFAAIGSETAYDWLWWRIDGELVNGISGNALGIPLFWKSFTFPVPPGTHTIEWAYEKDATNSESIDEAWIDGILIMNVDQLAKSAPRESYPDLPDGFVLWSDYASQVATRNSK